MEKQRLNEAITKLLGIRLEKYKDIDFNVLTCLKIYNEIFDTLVEVVTKSNVPLCNESLNYIAQMYYDNIKINNTHELDPNIFTQRAKLDNIVTKDVILMAVMFYGSPFNVPFIQEIKRRN